MDRTSEELVTTLILDLLLLALMLLFYVPIKNARSHPDATGRTPPYCERTSSVTSLVSRVYRANDEEILRSCQADGYNYLVSIRLFAILVGVVSFIGLTLLLPLYSQGDTDVDSDLNEFAVQHILENENYLWAVVACWIAFSLLFYFTAGYFLYKVHSVASKEHSSIEAQSAQISKLPTTQTPEELQSILVEYFDKRFPGSVLSLYVVPDVTEIYILQRQLKDAQDSLVSCQAYLEL
jgi:hypothetical protein